MGQAARETNDHKGTAKDKSSRQVSKQEEHMQPPDQLKGRNPHGTDSQKADDGSSKYNDNK